LANKPLNFRATLDKKEAYADVEDLKRDIGFKSKTSLVEDIAKWTA